MFADIGFPNPEREQLMAHLILQIYRIINSRRCEIAMNSGIFLSAQLQGDLRVERLARRVHEKCRFAHYSDCRWQRVVAMVLQVVSRHRLDHRLGACPGGSAVLYLDGMTKNSIVAGPILIASGIAWALHDRWRVTWFVLMPMLLVLLGVLMLIARRPNIPERRARQT